MCDDKIILNGEQPEIVINEEAEFTPQDKAQIRKNAEDIAGKWIINTDNSMNYFVYDLAFLKNCNVVFGTNLKSLILTGSLNLDDYRGYNCQIAFSTNSNVPSIIVDNNCPVINWIGDECETADGVSQFRPVAGKTYNLLFSYDGKAVQCLVISYIPANRNRDGVLIDW